MRAQSKTALLATCGLAILVAVILWINDRGEDASPSDSASTAAPRESRPGAVAFSRGSSPPRDDDSRGPKPAAPVHSRKRKFGERPLEEGLDPEAQRRRVFRDAVHAWRVESQQKVLTCLPEIGTGSPSEMRVVFQPLPDPPAWLSPRLIASTVERAGIDPQDDMAPPFSPEVRGCLDLLLGAELEIPEGSPELETGYEVLLLVPL